MDAWFIKKKWPPNNQSAANANQAATLEKSQQEDECKPNPALPRPVNQTAGNVSQITACVVNQAEELNISDQVNSVIIVGYS